MDNRYKHISRRDARDDNDDDNLFGESAFRTSYIKNNDFDSSQEREKSPFRQLSSPRNKLFYQSGTLNSFTLKCIEDANPFDSSDDGKRGLTFGEERRRNRNIIDEENPFERSHHQSKNINYEHRRDYSESENEILPKRKSRGFEQSDERKEYERDEGDEDQYQSSPAPPLSSKKAVKSAGSTFRRLEKNISRFEEDLKAEVQSTHSRRSHHSYESLEEVSVLDRLDSDGRYINPNENLSREQIKERYRKLIYVRLLRLFIIY